jgi:AAA domain
MFKPATREKTRARVLLAGPSGSGKTRAALEIARGLGDRIAVIDTENRSASLYVGLNGIAFDVCELSPPYTYDKYLQAMRECFAARAYDVLVIDSLTHVWSGEGGALEVVDEKSRGGGNKFTAFADVTPLHNRLLSTITASPVHILCTVRTKTAYVLEEKENRYGKMVQVPRKVGLAPIFRDGVEYEFSVQLDINLDHEVTVAKTRITELDGAKFAPNELARIGATMREFHDSGTLPKLQAVRPSPAPARDPHAIFWFKGTKHSGKPLTELETQSLVNYIGRLEKAMKDDRWAEQAQPYYDAAQRELEHRQLAEAEAAGANPATGEVPPPDDLAEKLQRSIDRSRGPQIDETDNLPESWQGATS